MQNSKMEAHIEARSGPKQVTEEGADAMKQAERRTLFRNLQPLAVLTQVLGALPLSGIMSRAPHLDAHFRWAAWPLAYSAGLHALCTAVNHAGTEDPWYRLIQPYFHCRNALYVLSFAAVAQGLPPLLATIHEFDALVGALAPLEPKPRLDVERVLGWACAAGNAVVVVVTTALLGADMPRPSVLLFLSSPLVGNAPVAARGACLSLFLLLCLALRRRLAALRSLSCRSLSSRSLSEQRSPSAELERCRLLHALLTSAASRGLSRAFGPLLAASVSSVSVEVLLDLYQVVYGNKGLIVTYNVINILTMCSIADFGHRLSTDAQEIVDDLKHARLSRMDVESQKQVVMFMAQISASPVHVSAAGFCVVNRGMLVSILMAMTTYFIAIVQSAEDLKKYTGVFLDQKAENETKS